MAKKTDTSRRPESLNTILTFLLVTTAFPAHVCSYNILMVPFASKSHVFSLTAIADGLAKHGHSSTFLIGESYRWNGGSGISVVRYRDAIDGLPVDYDAVDKNISRHAIEHHGDMSRMSSTISQLATALCRDLLADDHFSELDQQKFYLAVVDRIFFAKCIYLVPHRLGIPWITYSDNVDPLTVRAPWLPSFVSNPMFPFTERMSFLERVENAGSSLLSYFFIPLIFPEPLELVAKYQRYGSLRTLDDLVSSSALFIQPRDHVLDYPRPAMPNIVHVGGMTVNRSSGELPAEIENFMTGGKKGAILVTFGSMVSILPVHMVEKFSSAFGRLDGYRIIWRLENRDNVHIPDNVMLAKWLPQTDILAHPLTKLFITHSGNGGQYEAVYYGVPMVGFAVFGDQFYNAKRLDHKGFGISIDLYDFTADQLLDSVHRVLGDKSYKDRVVKASEIFRSQPQSPMERATFWIEHVCRFGGDHLRSAGNDLPLYSYLMLDVLAVILVALHIIAYLCYRVLKLVLGKLCRRKPSVKTSKKTD